MQNSLNLKSYEEPKNFDQAKSMIKDLMSEIEQTHKNHNDQIKYLKQQFKIALKNLRPGLIPSHTLAEMFDEPQMTTEPVTEPEISDDLEPKKSKKRKKKRKAIPDHLPRTIIEVDILEEQKTCGEDGSELKPMGYDVKEELHYVPAKFEVIEYRYPKYVCKTCESKIIREEPKPTLIPQSYASAGLLANIAAQKYVNHLPLYRQEQIYAREGVHLTRQVMADWMIRLGDALSPLIGIMKEKILESPVVSADETPVRVLTKNGVRTSHQAYMWQLSRWGPSPLVYFEYDQTRKKEVAERLFGPYEGYVQIDGYAGYDSLFAEGSKMQRVGCMAHVLRKFRDYLSVIPKKDRANHPARQILKLIGKLYDIEEGLRGRNDEERKNGRIESDASECFDELVKLVENEKDEVSQSSPYFKALNYASEELPMIKKYFDHGMIELDNNLAENAIRPFALGKKNWMFICSERGAEASANIYSLLITAKANQYEPYSYLKNVIEKLPLCKTAEDFEELLPALS